MEEEGRVVVKGVGKGGGGGREDEREESNLCGKENFQLSKHYYIPIHTYMYTIHRSTHQKPVYH